MSAAPDPRAVGTIWIYDLRQPAGILPPGLSPEDLPQVHFQRTGPEDAARLGPFLDAAVVDGFIERLKDKPDCRRRLYTAWSADRLAGYGWVSFDSEAVGELGVRLRLEPCEVYLWDFYTLPAYRNRHVYAAMLAWLAQTLSREADLCRAWIGADLDNAPSQRGIDRAGYRRVADLLFVHESGRRVMRLQGYPGVEERLVAEARRVFLGGVEG